MTSDRHPLPLVLADTPLSPSIEAMLDGRIEILPWHAGRGSNAQRIEAIYTYGHPHVGADLLDKLPGVGVDHMYLAAVAAAPDALGEILRFLPSADRLALVAGLPAGSRARESGRLPPLLFSSEGRKEVPEACIAPTQVSRHLLLRRRALRPLLSRQ